MALVYGVPHVGFGERVPKLDLMMRTWDPAAPDGAADPEVIAEHGLRAVNDRRADFEPAIKALQDAGVGAKVIIGGAPVTQNYADKIGAHGYSPDAASAVDLAKSMVA